MSNPYHLLGMEKKFALDMKTLEKAYFEAQKKTHPDQFINKSAPEKQEASQRSAALNQAYLILKDPLKRAEFLIKDANIDLLSHDPLFLQKVMDWQEQTEDQHDVKDELQTTKKTLLHHLEKAFLEDDYETARMSLYQLTYVHKLLKELH